MGLLSKFKQVLGLAATAAATAEADPDDLFAMSTAAISMEADLGYQPTGTGALCFADVSSTRFRETMVEVEEILAASDAEFGTVSAMHEDDHGYQWVVIEAPVFEDLVTGLAIASNTLMDSGFGSRLLAGLFAFEATERASAETGQVSYWIYSFRRGTFYPFVPVGTDERHDATEFKLKSVMDGELSVEDDREYWYPLWPDSPGSHPWE